MTSVYEIIGWADLAPFLAWTLVVCALAKTLFGSFLAAEFQHRLNLRDNPRRQRMQQLEWELVNRQERVLGAEESPHAARTPLTEAALATRASELRKLGKLSFWRRVLAFFFGCFACQTFWAAIGIFVITQGVADLRVLVLTALAYSAAAVLLASLNARLGAIDPKMRKGCS